MLARSQTYPTKRLKPAALPWAARVAGNLREGFHLHDSGQSRPTFTRPAAPNTLEQLAFGEMSRYL